MELPLYTFWTMYKNVHRIRAEEDQRMFGLLMNVIGGDPKAYMRSLEKQQGRVFETYEEPVFDKEGLSKLKNLMKGK